MKNTLRVSAGIEVVRRDKETTSSLLRRFNQAVRSSGLVAVTRKNQYNIKQPNRRARRESALVRLADRHKYQKIRKMGRTEKK